MRQHTSVLRVVRAPQRCCTLLVHTMRRAQSCWTTNPCNFPSSTLALSVPPPQPFPCFPSHSDRHISHPHQAQSVHPDDKSIQFNIAMIQQKTLEVMCNITPERRTLTDLDNEISQAEESHDLPWTRPSFPLRRRRSASLQSFAVKEPGPPAST